jgi:NAD(P)-dependent dehydrogenase (short-subunit alcohol dehydrogenase family)
MDEADRTLVGIIGAGRLGVAMARTVRRAGRNVVIANFRGPDSLTSVVSMLGEGAAAGTVEHRRRRASSSCRSHGHASPMPSRDSSGTVRA